MSLRVVPVDYETAARFVDANHRHHRRPVGHKFSVGVANDLDELVGVAMVGWVKCPECGHDTQTRPRWTGRVKAATEQHPDAVILIDHSAELDPGDDQGVLFG